MRSAALPLYQAFIYDFAFDGGATGTIQTGIQLPNKAAVRVIGTYIDVAILGAADVSLGTTTTPTLLTGGAAVTLANPEPVAYSEGFFTQSPAFGIMDNTLNIILTIATAPITAGRFSVYLQYFLFQ